MIRIKPFFLIAAFFVVGLDCVKAQQQVLGLFPQMDGGFEGQSVSDPMPNSTASTQPTTSWTKSSATGTSSIRRISGSGGRTGNNFLSINNSGASGTVVVLSPYAANAAVTGGGAYVIQCYYRATDLTTLPNNAMSVGLSNAVGTGVTVTPFVANAAVNNAAWLKSVTPVIAASGAAPGNGFSSFRFTGIATTNGSGIDLDDWVIYPGTVEDIIPPSNPGAASTSNPSGSSIDLSWGASADVDGGGYMVVRYSADPTLQPNPNNNGLYKTGNSIGAGTVAYIGSSVFFTDAGLSNNSTYYYRVYAVDKAFNYSNASTAVGTTNSTVSVLRYYIDFAAGNDADPGSITLPWKNITKLNTLTLLPGTEVLLKCGSVWTGQRLKFSGSGTALNPIIINKYGTGAAPILAGNGLTGDGVLYLYNQQYIEINNLEITNSPNGPINSDFFVGTNNGTINNNPLGADRRGVMVAIDNFGTANHIYLKNLNIHHIKGQLGNGNTTINGAIPKRTGGIYFAVLGNTEQTATKSRFNDVLIDSCAINYCENTGLAFDNEWNVYYPGGSEYNDWYDRRFTNVWVKNNTIHHIGKNAMIIRCTDATGLIERNVCYETAVGTTGNTMFTARAKGTVFQYNEGYLNRATTQNVDPGNIDGSMYDPDFGSVGIIFQYSYSHDNSQGLYWGCNTRGSNNNTTGIPDPGDTACTARYNISQNDYGDLVYFNYSSAGNEIYNNVFFTRSGLSPNIIHENSGNSHTYHFYNNIIYNLSSATSGASYAFGSGPSVQTAIFSNNVFFGNHHVTEPAGINKSTLDPMFLAPGSGTYGLSSVEGYKLKTTSPFIGTGLLIGNNGGKDFFGNALSATAAPNRGVYEGPGLITLPVGLTAFGVAKNFQKASLSWSTLFEQNSFRFCIERSSDGISFSKIGELRAAGNSSVMKSYFFTDELPKDGKNYYRLRQEDDQTNFTHSAVRMLDFSSARDWKIFPNPVKGELNLHYADIKTESVVLEVMSLSGKSIITARVNASNGVSKLPAAALAPGMYLLQVLGAANREVLVTLPFIKE